MIAMSAIAAGAGICAYVSIVALLRFQRVSNLPRRHGYIDRALFSEMTVEEAQSILKELSELDCPLSLEVGYLYALFRTYGIPSMTKLLSATGQLSCPEFASKRTADTVILLQEMLLNAPSNGRALLATARINYLHDRFRKKRAISDADMLYTLALFALGQRMWIEKFEWRSMIDLELCATGVYWRSVGDAMRIPYGVLASSQDGWRDGLHWLEELEAWSAAYEQSHMKYHKANAQLANSQLDVLFEGFPSLGVKLAKRCSSVFMDNLLREALGFPTAPYMSQIVCHGMLALRRLFLRYLSPPRPRFLRRCRIQWSPDADTGRYNVTGFVMKPWYTKPTFLTSFKVWFRGNLIGDGTNPDYGREGYLIEDLGPAHLAGTGRNDMEEQINILRELRRSH